MKTLSIARWFPHFILLFCLIPLLACSRNPNQSQRTSDVDLAIARLQDPDPKVRLDSVGKLYDLKDRRSVKPLIAALNDPDPEVSRLAAAALVQLQDIRTVELLIAVLKDPSAQSRALAAAALGQIKHPMAIRPLMAA